VSRVKTAGSVRERLLQTAGDLFYREGIHTVGIDRILAEAGVAKASLYSTFRSKDELVRAYLEERASWLRGRIEQRVAAASDPQARILAIFDDLSDRVMEARFYNGCPFIRACAEGAPDSGPAREVASSYRAWQRELFARLAKEAGMPRPSETSRQLSLIYDGATVTASMNREPGVGAAARKLVERLLAESVSPAPERNKKAAARRGPLPKPG
jgi:AcrR family transcriptional regulator